MRQRRTDIKRGILVRVKFLYAMFFLIGLCIFGRILWIQYGPEGASLRQKAERRNFSVARVDASRGDIFARDGQLLATSVQRYHVGIDFKATGLTEELFRNNVAGLASSLSRFFGDRSAAAYRTMLETAYRDRNKEGRRYKRITPRLVDYNELQTLKTFPLLRLPANRGGRVEEPLIERERPFGMLAERTIGKTVEVDMQVERPSRDTSRRSQTTVRTVRGSIGIEQSYDDKLRGEHGWVLKQKISGNFWIPVANSDLNVEPVNGKDVVTTIDMDYQDVAESALRQRLLEAGANWGTVVLMEVATGEIRAIANLTRKGDACYEDNNYAIGGRFEPGSTFKLASLITLLDDAGMDLDEEIDTEGGVAKINGRTYYDDHKEGVITLQRVFEVSSNIGFIKAVDKHYKDRPKRFVECIRDLGFDKPLETGIIGEAVPKMWGPDDKGRGQWSGVSLNNMAYGYGFEISPLHTLTLYNAIANGGKMVRPKLVRSINAYGEELERFDTEVINSSICSDRTLRRVRQCLEGVVDAGTGSALKNPYYTVAAKTGTAQMLSENGRYTDEWGGRNYLATMVGYFPADNPKYSCIVAIKTYYGRGSYQTYYGASLAGPVFKAVADRVYATNIDWQQPVREKYERRTELPMPVKGGNLDAVKQVAHTLGGKLDTERHSAEWVRTSIDSTAIHTQGVATQEGLVPSVIGMGLKDAIYLLEREGLRVNFSGRGRVVSQTIRAGSRAVKGQTIGIRLN